MGGRYHGPGRCGTARRRTIARADDACTQSREELIETALMLQDKKMAMRPEIDRLRRVIAKQRAWGRLSLSFIASGVLFAVILIEGAQHLWSVPLVLIESVFGGFVRGFCWLRRSGRSANTFLKNSITPRPHRRLPALRCL
jgi:Flp pilus assembly protein TadB